MMKKNNAYEKVAPVKNAGDRRRGLYTFAYEQEAEAWDKLFPTKKEIARLIAKNANAGEFLNAEALVALSDRRTGNFINPLFINMLDERLAELGYSIVDESRKMGVPKNVILQHVNYYYDYVAIALEQFKQKELEFYESRYGLKEQVEEESLHYVDDTTKECYDFVDDVFKRFYEANGKTVPSGGEGPDMQ